MGIATSNVSRTISFFISAASTSIQPTKNSPGKPGTSINILIELGLLENEQGRLELARHHLKRALRLNPTHLESVISANNHLGLSYLFEAEQRKEKSPTKKVETSARNALKYFRVSMRGVKRVGDPEKIANGLGNIGLALTFLKRFKTAERNFDHSLRLFRTLRLRAEEASCMGNLGYLYKEMALSFRPRSIQCQRNLRKSLEINKKAHALKMRVSAPRRIALSKHSIGEIYHLLGFRSHSLRWLNASLEILVAEKLESYAVVVRQLIQKIIH